MSRKLVRIIMLISLFLLLTSDAIAQENAPDTQFQVKPLVWEQINPDGFGSAGNNTVWSLAVYQNELYAGTRNPSTGAQLWHSSDGISWSPITLNGLGDSNNTAFSAMAVSAHYLYVGTENSATGTEIWRYDGSNWMQINPDGFGSNSNRTAWSMYASFNSDDLYVGTRNNTTGGQIHRYYDITASWSPFTTNGMGDPHNASITSLAYFNYELYAGTWNDVTGAEVWKKPGSSPWWQINADGFGDAHNLAARSMAILGDFLYVGTYNGTDGGEIWACGLGSCNFYQLASVEFDNPNNIGVSALLGFGDYLYAATENIITGSEIWRSVAGYGWEHVNPVGFGDPNNHEAPSLARFGALLVAGTRNFSSGGEVWRTSPLGTSRAFLVNDPASQINVDAISPTVAYNPRPQYGEYLVVWNNDKPANDDIQAQRVSRDGRKIGPDFYISGGVGVERHRPSVAYDSNNNRYLVIWEYSTDSEVGIKAQLVPPYGGTLGGEITVVSSPKTGDYWKYYSPKVAFSPTSNRYLVAYFKATAWDTAAGVDAQVLYADGNPDGGAIPVRDITGGYSTQIDLAYNPARIEFLIVWPETSGSKEDIFGRRVKMTGGAGTQGDAFPISTNTSGEDDWYPAVAALSSPPNVGQYLVAWAHNTTTLTGGWNSDVWAARITGEGVPLEDHLLVSASLPFLRPHAIAADEARGSYTVIWQSDEFFPPSYVYRREVSSAGEMLGPAVWVGGIDAWGMDIAYSGRRDYLVAFSDYPLGVQEYQIWASPVAYWLFLPLIRR